MDLKLEGKRVLVTGGSKGIGRACAEAFAAEGAKVKIASRNPPPGPGARVIDLSQHGAAEALAEWAGAVYARMKQRRSGVIVNIIDGGLAARSS